MSVKIYVVCHKKAPVLKNNYLKPIIVGKNDFELDNALRDNVGDNISDKNLSYCELTALYWLWKHKMQDDDYIGLCHYRRYFTKSVFVSNNRISLTEKDISGFLKDYDIILPWPDIMDKSVYENYFTGGAQGKEKDLKKVINIIEEKYKDYSASCQSILTCNMCSYCNMFIMRSELAQKYCDWLFSVLSEAEEEIDRTGYTVAENRVFGYLSEILLNVWVRKNKLRIKYISTVQTDRSSYENLRTWFHKFRLRIGKNMRRQGDRREKHHE